MNVVIDESGTRGHANHGWLDTRHTFSFADYWNPDRVRFGALRVLNDDVIAPGRGFGMHGHDNMEIITIPIRGELEHRDNMGNSLIISEGDIQAMSAGTGVFHSEYNRSKRTETNLLQIWVMPNKRGVAPRYDQASLRALQKENRLYQVLSPNPDDAGVWIHQDAWFHLGDFKPGAGDSYHLRSPSYGKSSGVYAFCIEGRFKVNDVDLSRRDGVGITGVSSIDVKAISPGTILLMEVPINDRH